MSQLPQCHGVLDVFCPMHLVVNQSGHITHCGPTLRKLRPDDLVGRRVLEVFHVKRPRGIGSVADLKMAAGTKLHLQFRDAPHTQLKGVLVSDDQTGMMTINLSFGISIIDSVQDFALTSADFAPTDLTIEMLYLVEAKSAAMDASRKLNLRLQGAMIAAEEQAFTDTLTGLKNRRAMEHVLKRYVKSDRSFAIMQIDLDWFKQVNDTLGHAAGDHVLQCVAEALVAETRETDTAVRAGGDEFVVILPDTFDEKILSRIAERIIERLSKPIPYQGETCRISASIGTACYTPDAGVTLSDVQSDADVALYASKHGGRAQHSHYNPDMRDVVENLAPPKGRATA